MPESLLTVLEKTTAYFKEKGIESPRLNAELLLCHLLKLKRLELYLKFDRPFADGELEQFRALVRKRGQRMPLQYVTGIAYFRCWEFAVGEGVLIPRPETEIVVDVAIKRSRESGARRILDFGAGSGAIAVSLVKEIENAEVIGLERSDAALWYARKNADKNGADFNRLAWTHAGTLDSSLGRFDLMVSNPPYIPSKEIPQLQPEVRFEPTEALDGGPDGLDYYRMFATEVPRILNPGGRLVAEIGFGQQEAIKEIFESAGAWQNMAFHPDLAGIPRVLEAQLRQS